MAAVRPRIPWKKDEKPILRRVEDDDPEIAVYKISDELMFVADGHVYLGYYYYSEGVDGYTEEGFTDDVGLIRKNVTAWSLLPEVPK